MKHGTARHEQHKRQNRVLSQISARWPSRLETSQTHATWRHAMTVLGYSHGWATQKAQVFLDEIITFLTQAIGLQMVQIRMMRHKCKKNML